MFKVTTHILDGFLGGFLYGIGHLEGIGTGIALQRLYQNIIINIGSNFYTSDPYKVGPGEENQAVIWINGQHEKAFALDNPGETKMFVISIKPGMLSYFSKVPVVETNGRALSADHWAAEDIFELRDKLLQSDIEEGFQLIEDYLIHKLVGQDFSAMKTIEYLNNAMPDGKVEEICYELGYTRKKLRTEAIVHFGAPVKNMQGIIRFNKHLGNIANNPYNTLSSLHTYYDQAHFINDFKTRTGMVPGQYRLLCQEYPMIKNTPNFIPIPKETFLQFIARHPA